MNFSKLVVLSKLVTSSHTSCLINVTADPVSNFDRLKVFLSRVMRCQEGGGGGEEDDPPLVPRLGTRTGSILLFSTTTRFCDMKQKRNYSFLTSRSIAKTSYTIRLSGVLLQTGRVFLMTFIVGVKSYMEVSNETSDRTPLPTNRIAI